MTSLSLSDSVFLRIQPYRWFCLLIRNWNYPMNDMKQSDLSNFMCQKLSGFFASGCSLQFAKLWNKSKWKVLFNKICCFELTATENDTCPLENGCLLCNTIVRFFFSFWWRQKRKFFFLFQMHKIFLEKATLISQPAWKLCTLFIQFKNSTNKCLENASEMP